MNTVFYLQRGVRPKLPGCPEQYLCLERFAENMNHAPLVAVIRSILDNAVFENGIRKGTRGKLTQQGIVIRLEHFERYLHTLRVRRKRGVKKFGNWMRRRKKTRTEV